MRQDRQDIMSERFNLDRLEQQPPLGSLGQSGKTAQPQRSGRPHSRPSRSFFLPTTDESAQNGPGWQRMGWRVAAVVMVSVSALVWMWGGADEDASASNSPATGSAYQDPWQQLATATAQADDAPLSAGRTAALSLAQCQAMLMSMLAKDPSGAWRLALQWASERPDWAQALVDPLLEPLWQRRMFDVMLQGLDQATGLELALRSAWMDATLVRWTETAPTQAANWAANWEAHRAAYGAAHWTAAGAASGNAAGPADGARPGAGGADLLAVVNDRWAHQDARSATVFASTLPPSIGRPLLTESLNRWLALDGLAAREWIRAQGATPALDASIVQHATQDELARQSPREAVDLVHRITDPSVRQQAQWALARTFRDIDPGRQDWQAMALTGGQPLPGDEGQASGSD